jgi:hypothetical protein
METMVIVPRTFLAKARLEYDRRYYAATFEAFLKSEYRLWTLVYYADTQSAAFFFKYSEDALAFKLKHAL